MFQRNKAPNEQTIPLLMPQHHMVIPHYMGSSKEMEVERKIAEDTYRAIKREDSVSSLSSFQDIPLLIPQEADELRGSNVDSKSNGLDDQPSRGSKGPFSFRKSKNEPLVEDTPMKGFVDNLDSVALKHDLSSDISKRTSEKEWWETQERGDQVVSADETGQVGPRVSCRCQVSSNSWS